MLQIFNPAARAALVLVALGAAPSAMADTTFKIITKANPCSIRWVGDDNSKILFASKDDSGSLSKGGSDDGSGVQLGNNSNYNATVSGYLFSYNIGLRVKTKAGTAVVKVVLGKLDKKPALTVEPKDASIVKKLDDATFEVQ
jgi:hypothetical protein